MLAQYRECSAQHISSYALTWQVAAVTTAVSGFLVAATFGYGVSDVVRMFIAFVGAHFVLTMTVAVERRSRASLRRSGIAPEPIPARFPLGTPPA